jgi:hypothetical protein
LSGVVEAVLPGAVETHPVAGWALFVEVSQVLVVAVVAVADVVVADVVADVVAVLKTLCSPFRAIFVVQVT